MELNRCKMKDIVEAYYVKGDSYNELVNFCTMINQKIGRPIISVFISDATKDFYRIDYNISSIGGSAYINETKYLVICIMRDNFPLIGIYDEKMFEKYFSTDDNDFDPYDHINKNETGVDEHLYRDYYGNKVKAYRIHEINDIPNFVRGLSSYGLNDCILIKNMDHNNRFKYWAVEYNDKKGISHTVCLNPAGWVVIDPRSDETMLIVLLDHDFRESYISEKLIQGDRNKITVSVYTESEELREQLHNHMFQLNCWANDTNCKLGDSRVINSTSIHLNGFKKEK